jgi:formylmethanofuran dehydrogenase subunit B
MDSHLDRPYGWGICASCGQDCDDEADYDETTHVSICLACRARPAQSADEQQAEEVFTRR